MSEIRKNPDYSASAVNLTNSEEVHVLMRKRQVISENLAEAEAKAAALIPDELKNHIKSGKELLANCEEDIRKAIEAFGSYQDIALGWYAVKQRRLTKIYNADNFESYFPDYASAALVKSVNVPVLQGLIKGQLVTEDGLKRASVITETESFAYIIK